MPPETSIFLKRFLALKRGLAGAGAAAGRAGRDFAGGMRGFGDLAGNSGFRKAGLGAARMGRAAKFRGQMMGQRMGRMTGNMAASIGRAGRAADSQVANHPIAFGIAGGGAAIGAGKAMYRRKRAQIDDNERRMLR